MCNVHFGFVVHVNSHCIVHSVFLCHSVSNVYLLGMNVFHLGYYFIIQLLLLTAKAIDPVLFWFYIVSNDIKGSISKIFLPELKRSLDFDLLHAAIIRLSFNIWSWHINSLIGVKVWRWIRNHFLILPLISYINNGFWLGLQQTLVSFESVRANWNLAWCSKADFDC